MTSLHDRLNDLAEHAPAAVPGSVIEWDRGRHVMRVRRVLATTIVVAAVGALAATGLVARDRTRPTPVNRPVGSSPALSDRLFEPSPWLPGTDEVGPPGPLALIRGAERRSWTSSSYDAVGVSAITGEYRFLDLPGADLGAGYSLSPNGRRVAFWTTGETPGLPNHVFHDIPITGIATYDTVTGEVNRLPLITEHGVGPTAMLWASPEELVFQSSRIAGGDGDPIDDQQQATIDRLQVWRPGDADARPVPASNARDQLVSATRGRVLVDGRDGLRIVDLRSSVSTGIARYPDQWVGTAGPPAIDPSGRRIAVVWQGQDVRNAGAAVVPEVGARITVVKSSSLALRVLAWVDSGHLAVNRRLSADVESDAYFNAALDVIDLRTGTSRRVLTYPPTGDGAGGIDIATDLLAQPSFPAAKPPTPSDPRVTAAVAGGIAAAAGLVLLFVVRRRPRARR